MLSYLSRTGMNYVASCLLYLFGVGLMIFGKVMLAMKFMVNLNSCGCQVSNCVYIQCMYTYSRMSLT